MKIGFLMRTCLVFAALASHGAYAAAYKWVDKDGVTHYSQSRPDRAPYELIESKSKEPAQKSAPTPASEPAKPAQATAPEDNVRKEELTQKCQKVRDEMAKLESIARVSLKQGDEVKVLSEQEKQALIDERRDWLAKYCK